MPSASLSIDAAAHERELSEVLERYLISLEEGKPLDVEDLARAHPDLAEEILDFSESIDQLHQASRKITSEQAPGQGYPLPSPWVETREPTAGEVRRLLGDFEIGPEIGRGGMGIVYEAFQLSLQGKVALKMLPLAAMWDEKQLARFQLEAQAAARLHHPNIVPVFAVGQQRGTHYYAMQLIEGNSLDKVIGELRTARDSLAKQGPLTNGNEPEEELSTSSSSCSGKAPEAESTARLSQTELEHSHVRKTEGGSRGREDYYRAVAKIGIQAAQALHYAHQRGIIHRDVKPSNLILDHTNKLWIADFGLARSQDSPGVTVTGDVVGTLRYMSPEQATGKDALVDARTDIYSLGASLYELVALEPAFSGEDRHQVLTQVAEDNPRALRYIDPQIPVDLETIILHSMAKLREERYDSAEQFASDLGCFLEGKPTVARRPTLIDRSSKWVRRHRTMVSVAAGFLVLLTLLSGLSALMLSREQARTQAALNVSKKHLQESRAVVDRFGAHFAEQLAQLPGSSDLRHTVLTVTLQYYEDFLRDSEDDRALNEQVAATHFQLATIASHLGQLEKAEQSFKESVALFRRLQDLSLTGKNYHREIATSWNNLALLLASEGRIPEADGYYRQALELLAKSKNSNPLDQREANLSSEILVNLALLEQHQGKSAAAEESISQAIAVLEKVAAKHPKSSKVKHDLALALNNRSFVQKETNLAAARDSSQRALLLFEELATLQANDSLQQAERLSDLALCHNNLAAILGHLHEHDLSRTALQQCRRAPGTTSSAISPSCPASRKSRDHMEQLGTSLCTRGGLGPSRALSRSR